NRAVDSLRTGSAAIFRAETGAARPAGRCRLPPSVTERQHPPPKLLDSPGERPRVVDFEGPLTYRHFTEFLRVNLTRGCHETVDYCQRGPAVRAHGAGAGHCRRGARPTEKRPGGAAPRRAATRRAATRRAATDRLPRQQLVGRPTWRLQRR